ncbi:putative phd finger protein [Schistosoma mansoni]|uniref:putative phd finger protein n=1 Tax=Schistosoma mansoni TaxID=6183 RepID=UPI00022DC73B|nr:putative phd finger protein [Schistosoma mansoni]|eukprot:XP_018648788.1 putative phd finger protein [Schistosoma mansoni]
MLRLKKWRSNRQLTLHGLDEKKSNVSCLRDATMVDPRIQRKLEHYRKLYKDVLRNREKPYVPLVKTPMFLETSPVAMRMFVLKAKALNLPIELSNHMSNADSSKGPTPSYPVFTPDFVSYFLERERKITEVSKLIATLQNTQRELQISDASASHSYNSVSTELEKLNSSRGSLRAKFVHIINSLRSLIPELKCSLELETILAEPRRLPETASFDLSSLSNPVNSNKTVKFGSSAVIAASKRRGNRSSPCKLRKASKSEAVDQNAKSLDISTASHPEKCSSIVTYESENVILECMICHGLQDQHLITSCDTCGKAFHLACLDPPLLRMPKRSKLYGWQCSFCTKEVSSVPGAETIDVNAPRQLRRSSGIPSDRTTCVKTEDLKPDVDPISQVSGYPVIPGEIKPSPTREPVSKTLRRSHPLVSSAPSYQGNFGNPVKNGKRTSSLSSKRISMSASKQTKRCVSSQLPLEKDVKINIGCKVSTSPSVVMTHVCSADFDQFKFTDETEDDPMIHAGGGSLKSKCESDEEIAHLRSSKGGNILLKIVRIFLPNIHSAGDLPSGTAGLGVTL